MSVCLANMNREGGGEVSRSRNIESVIASNGIESNEYKIGGEGLFVCRG